MGRSILGRYAGLAAAAVAAAAAAAAVGALVVAGPASAHVTVSPAGEATQGERARVDFRVPNERDAAATTALAVHFPEAAPISSASVGAVPGWQAEVTYRELSEPVDDGHGGEVTQAVAVITWTAGDEDAAIAPGEFGEFPVSLGPLPHVDQLAFPALQTYSDGEVVRWIEPSSDGDHPDRPAPVLALAAAGTAADGEPDAAAEGAAEGAEEGTAEGPAEGAAAAAGPETADVAAVEPAGDSGSGTGTWLGLAGLVAGLAGLAVAAVAFARTRREPGRADQ